MDQDKQGFPPGVNVRRREQKPAEKTVNIQKKAVQEFGQEIPGGLKGTPVEWGDFGPDIDEAGLPPQEAIEERLAQNQRTVAPQRPMAPPPPQTATPAPNPVRDRKHKHPVLERMLDKLGLRTLHKYELVIEVDEFKFTYTMTQVSEELTLWALNEAQVKATREGDTVATPWFNLVHACSAVVAIDGVPTHEIFSIRPTPEEERALSEDKNNLSVRLRKASAKSLADLLWTEVQPIGDKLVDFFREKVMLDRRVISNLEKEKVGFARYVCPTDNCSENYYRKPIIEENIENDFFCSVHGIPMVKVATQQEDQSVPLA